ncbi:MAG: inositol monophosphatase family protein [Spirochaetaceae bacterium]
MPVNRLSLYEAAREAARLGGQRSRQLLHAAAVRSKSESYDLVTDADLETERYIREVLLSRFPKHEILGEEGGGSTPLDAPALWIVDPIDGTNNFVHGIPHYGCSVAYAEGGEVVAGAVFDPERGELFSAYLGGGAYLNGERIGASAASRLSEAMVCTGFYYDRGTMMRRTLEAIERLFEAKIHGIRRTGSAALDICWTACGRFDAYFEFNINPWDFAAGVLILEEAGGIATGSDGTPLSLKSRQIVCSGRDLHRELISILP